MWLITSVSKGCVCPDGYKGDVDGKCVDHDECATFVHDCDIMANCINTIGAFNCECINGYEGNEAIIIIWDFHRLVSRTSVTRNNVYIQQSVAL